MPVDFPDFEEEVAALDDSFYDSEAWVQTPLPTNTNTPLVPVVDHGSPRLWLRNADEYLPVLANSPYFHFAFTATDIFNKKISPVDLLGPVLPSTVNFEWLHIFSQYILICSRDQVLAEREPIRIPFWTPRQPPEDLTRLVEKAKDNAWPMVAVGMFRGLDKAASWRLQEWVYRLAALHPEVKIHLSFANSFRQMFGLNYASVDLNPSFFAKRKLLLLPNGKQASIDFAHRNLKWLHVLGYSVKDLHSVEGRVRFNIQAALWASENYRKAVPLSRAQAKQHLDPYGLLPAKRSRLDARTHARRLKPLQSQKMALPWIDPDDFPQTSSDMFEPYDIVQPVTNTKPIAVRPRNRADGDMIMCNSCSLAPKCDLFREGSVCTVKGSPMGDLAGMFGTRDTDTLKGVLAAVLAKQADRYERSTVAFHDDDESDIFDLDRAAHLMKMETSLVRSTEILMKILDPSFRESNVPSITATTTNIYNPRVLVADVVRQLEEKGFSRDQITPELMRTVIGSPQGEINS